MAASAHQTGLPSRARTLPDSRSLGSSSGERSAQQTRAAAKLSFTPTPALIRIVLRVTQRLIRNASHETRYIYNSMDHLCSLLADHNAAIVLLTLEILNMLLQRSPKLRAARVTPSAELNDRLMELAMGWGGRENGLGLLECCSSSAGELLSSDGRRLWFQYTKTSSSNRSDQAADSLLEKDRTTTQIDMATRRPFLSSTLTLRGGSCGPVPLSPSSSNSFVGPEDLPRMSTVGKTTTIEIEDVGMFKGDERWLLADYAVRSNIPKSRLFALLSTFRRAKHFCAGREGRLEATVIRLYAVTTLFSIQPHPISLQDLLTKEPEFLHDVVALAKAEAKDGVSDIPRSLRIIAIRCLTAMSCDRQAHSSVMNVTEANLHHGAIPTLLRTEIASLVSSGLDMTQSDVNEIVSDGMTLDTQVASKDERDAPSGPATVSTMFDLLAECERVSQAVQRVQLTESLLGLVYNLAMASRSDGATPLANSGVLGILIPLLSDQDMRHSRVVAKAIRAMQGIIEGSSQSIGRQLFREQDGLSLVAARIAVEVGVDDTALSDAEQQKIDDEVEVEALKRRGESRSLYQELGQRQMTPQEALEHQPPSSSATSRGQLPQSKWALLRSLLQLLLVSLRSGGNEVRALVAESKLPRALRKIVAQPFTHGGSLFQSAATITTDIAHAEPTATGDLVKAGIASTVLRTIEQGLPPCGEAVRCIPNLLAALCLAPSARDVIVSSRPLKQYLLRLATPFYTRALHGDIPIYIGSSLDELMRHVEALRPNGNEAMVEYLRMSAKFVNTDTRGFRRPGASDLPESEEEMDGERAAAAKRLKRLNSADNEESIHPEGDGERVSSDEALLDKMKLAVANNSCRLAGFAQGSSEHQEGVVKGGGLDQMIELRHGPALACPEACVRDGYVFSRHYPDPSTTTVSLVTSLRNLSGRHGITVLQSLFKVIVDDATLVLKLAKDLDDILLPEEEEVDKTSTVSDTRTREARTKTREELSRALRGLRLDVVLLSGLSRGGPGSSAGAWESSSGSHAASMIATVERAARFHLAKVYTGLTLRTSGEGDLNTARVTATGTPKLKGANHFRAAEVLNEINKAIGFPLTKSKAFEEACARYEVPPEGSEFVRQNVKGLAWQLVTFAVATQRLYSTLARGLTFNPRRPSRDPARYASSAKCLAATMGRIFALHLKAATPLWQMNVKTMEEHKVVAAWDFVRGVLIEIKGALFDEVRRVTQSLILKYFLEAGGAEALNQAMRPAHLVRSASMSSPFSHGDRGERLQHKFDAMLYDGTLSTASAILAASDAVSYLKLGHRLEIGRSPGMPEDKDDDTTMSSDSVSNQARAIARIAVTESGLSDDHSTSSGDQFRRMLADQKFIQTLRQQTAAMTETLLAHCLDVSSRRIAADVWNTCCGFLQLLGSCPGLGTSHGSSSDPSRLNQIQEWSPEDVQRSALSVSVHLLTDVIEEPQHLLASFTPDSPAMTDILGVVHSTSQISTELDKVSTEEQRDGPSGDERDSDARRDEPSLDPPFVNSEMLTSLVEMGFPEQRVRRALIRTGSRGIEAATDWLLTNPEDDDDESAHSSGYLEAFQEGSPSAEEEEGAEHLGDEEDGADDSHDEDAAAQESDDESESASDSESDDNAPSPDAVDDEIMVDAAVAEDGGNVPGEENEHGGDESTEGRPGPHPEGSLKFSSGNAAVMSIEHNGKSLLDHSVTSELNALTSALTSVKEVTQEEVSSLCAMGANKISSAEVLTSLNENLERTIASKPVSIGSFRDAKTKFFNSLTSLTKAIIQSAGTHIHSVHLPYFAVELLSVLQKDRSLSDDDSAAFAALLTSGLKHALTEELAVNGYAGSETRSSPAVLWAHYGGYRARNALRESGAFRLAFDSLQHYVDEWDCNQPNTIKKLSISEKQSIRNGDGVKSVSPLSGKDGAPPSAGPLRSPTRKEAVLLQRMTTCLLLLDANMRYELKDLVITRAHSASKARDMEKGGTGKKIREEMETDEPDADGAPAPSGDTATEAMVPTQGQSTDEDRVFVQNLVDEHMREIFGTGAMDIDDKNSRKDDETSPPNEEAAQVSEEEVENAKKGAMEKISDAVALTKKKIAELLPSKVGTSDVAVSNEALVPLCLRILKQWKTVEVGDAILAVLQLLGSLTKSWTLASLAHESHAIDLLLSLPHLDRKGATTTDGSALRFLTKTILRHIIEDPETLREAMEGEIRALTKSRQTTKSLLASAAPIVARDLQTFVSAAANTLKACEGSRGSHLELNSQRTLSPEVFPLSDARSNVRDVVRGLSRLLVKKDGRKGASQRPGASAKGQYKGLPLFALECIAEIAEVSRVAAVAFVEAPSPSLEVSGSALDFVIQAMLPQTKVGGSSRTLSLGAATINDLDEPANSVRKLFLALCSVSGNSQEEAVTALARSAELEAAKDRVSPGLISGIAHCIAPGVRLKVLRTILRSRLANDLARSLEKLDMSSEANSEVASSVLRALALIGQAASHLARHSDSRDDISFGSSEMNPWFSLREREDSMSASGSYMVL